MASAPDGAAPRRALPRTVLVLGGVSLLADVASEMSIPLLPVFLATTFGAGPAIIALIDGVGDTVSSLLKLWSGRLVDRGWPARGLAAAGYALTGLSRPLVALASGWGHVLAIRVLDRTGKGIRTAPRDALLAGATDEAARGRAFGFHRSMDHVGATIGPLVAMLLLAWGLGVRGVFVVSVIPGVLAAALLVFGVKRDAPRLMKPAPPAFAWGSLDARLRRLVLAAGILSAANVTDALLVLWLSTSGLPVVAIPAAWAGVSAARALVAFPAGVLSDRFGRLPVLVVAWLSRAAVLLAMPFLAQLGPWAAAGAVLLHATATAMAEGPERALVGDAAGPELRGTAFGAYHFAVGLAALPGALLLGGLWEAFGAGAAFATSAAVTVAAAGILVSGTRATGR